MRVQKVFVFTVTARKTIGTQEGQGYNGEWTGIGVFKLVGSVQP